MFSWGELFSTFLARKIMGVEGSCRSPNGGGVPLVVCSPYSRALPLLPAFPALVVSNFQTIGQNRAKVRFYLLGLVFSRDFGRQERAKIKDILKSRHNEGAR